MQNNKRNLFENVKTDFNHHHISQLSNIYKCCKCKRNNNILADIDKITTNQSYLFCLFCGTPNYVKREK